MNKIDTRWHKPIIRKGRFGVPSGRQPESLLFQTLPSFIQSLRASSSHEQHVSDWCLPTPAFNSFGDATIMWVGHATFLLCIDGVTILTDPIFGSPSWFFPRLLLPTISANDLPQVDAVLLSHNHPDHMDATTLHALNKKNKNTRYLVPHGDKRWFDRRGFAHAHEHTWWQSFTLQGNTGPVTCTFLPADHWSQRWLFDKNLSLWGSWMIQSKDVTIYFAGDTAYDSHFKVISQKFTEIDCALLPIGPCEPHDRMQHTHMDARQAVDAFIDLQAQLFVPMHWATFAFGTDSFLLPIERLQKAWKKVQFGMLTLPKVGQLVNVVPQSSYVLAKTLEQAIRK